MVMRHMEQRTKIRNRVFAETSDKNLLNAYIRDLVNAIINRPGPIMIGQALFVANLARAFRLVADYDRLIGLKRRR